MTHHADDTSSDDLLTGLSDRRDRARFELDMRIRVATQLPGRQGQAAGAGTVVDLSPTSISIRTTVRLYPEQCATLSVPTNLPSDDLFMPIEFSGAAEVVRVERLEDGEFLAALRFGPEFTQDSKFVRFMQYLHSISGSITVF